MDASVQSDITTVANQIETDAVDSQSYPSTSGWSYVDIGTITTGTVASTKLSPGVNVRYVSIPGGATGAYCLAGYATTMGASSTASTRGATASGTSTAHRVAV